MSLKPTVFAVVVTFKRPEVLKKCLEGIFRQSSPVSYVHVVVNCGQIETLELLNLLKLKYPVLSYHQYDNVGPAGGFYFGLKRFLTSPGNYVWVMDDDIIPDESCLKNLLQRRSYGCVFPAVFNKEKEEIRAFGWWGVLLSKHVVEILGFPIKDFFYWAEDTEYLQNRLIRVNKIIPFRCETALVEHIHQKTIEKPVWYYYYTVRNTIYYRKFIFPLNKKGWWRICNMYLGLLFQVVWKEKLAFPIKILYMGLGTFHGSLGKLGKRKSLH